MVLRINCLLRLNDFLDNFAQTTMARKNSLALTTDISWTTHARSINPFFICFLFSTFLPLSSLKALILDSAKAYLKKQFFTTVTPAWYVYVSINDLAVDPCKNLRAYFWHNEQKDSKVKAIGLPFCPLSPEQKAVP